MLKQIAEYIVSLAEKAQVRTHEIDGRKYATGMLFKIESPSIPPLKIHNLEGIADYIRSNYDGDHSYIIRIGGPNSVDVYGKFNSDMVRDYFLEVKALLPTIPFDSFIPIEQFIITLQSCFVETEERAAVLRVVGNIKDDNIRTTSDNGVSQVVTAKTGIATVEDVQVPNPVRLKPFRTFVEIEQPQSEFVLRLRKGHRDEIEAALFEADGGAWKLQAIRDIKAYLSENLAGEIADGKVTIVG